MNIQQVLQELMKNKTLFNYVYALVKNAYFETEKNKYISAIELVVKNFFNGLCWESSSLLSLFFEDTDLVQRGILSLPNRTYRHGWIEFFYNDRQYVFDPALAYLGTKQEYHKKYHPKYLASIPVYKVRQGLKQDILNYSTNSGNINPNDDINSPFYITNSWVSCEFDKDKVISLYARLNKI